MPSKRSRHEALVLFAGNLKLVGWAVGRMSRSRRPDEDAEDDRQDASIALFACCLSYREGFGTLANYAGKSLLRSIRRGRLKRRRGHFYGAAADTAGLKGREPEPWEGLDDGEGFIIPEHVESVRPMAATVVMEQLSLFA